MTTPTAVPMTSSPVLLIVDVQVDFCPGGALPVPDGDAVVPLANQLQRWALAQGWTVICSRDSHPPDSRHFAVHGGDWPVHCVAGTAGADFHPRLVTRGARTVLKGTTPDDDGYSPFGGHLSDRRTTLAAMLEQDAVTTIMIAGLATDYCVRAAALDARRAGLRTIVVTDACRAVDPEGTGPAAVEEMIAAGVELTTTARILRQGE